MNTEYRLSITSFNIVADIIYAINVLPAVYAALHIKNLNTRRRNFLFRLSEETFYTLRLCLMNRK